MAKRIIILKTQSGDWEGLFIDGELIDEGHHLGEGKQILYLLTQSEKYKFTSKDVCFETLNDEDEEITSEYGNFPDYLETLKGTYGF